MLMLSNSLSSIAKHFWALPSIAEHCYALKSITEHCWRLLRALLTSADHWLEEIGKRRGMGDKQKNKQLLVLRDAVGFARHLKIAVTIRERIQIESRGEYSSTKSRIVPGCCQKSSNSYQHLKKISAGLWPVVISKNDYFDHFFLLLFVIFYYIVCWLFSWYAIWYLLFPKWSWQMRFFFRSFLINFNSSPFSQIFNNNFVITSSFSYIKFFFSLLHTSQGCP